MDTDKTGTANDGQAAVIAANRQWAEQAFASEGNLPFSFVYGGRSSPSFLDGWKREVQDEASDDGVRRRTLTLTDPQTGLEVRAVCVIYTDTAGVDWTLHFTNRGAADTPVLQLVQAVDVAIAAPAGRTPVLHRLHGSSCAVHDWLPFDEPLPEGKRSDFATRDGKSSLGASPFFYLEWEGGGVITAVGWSGQWGAAVDHPKGGPLHLQACMQALHTVLHPGESIRSPRILQLYTNGNDPYVPYQLFRQTMFAHVMPRVRGEPVPPPIVHMSTSFYELNDSTEANTLSHLEPIRDLGFEYFWLDAYYTRDGFPQGMGHYGFPLERVMPPDRFPRGLKPVSDAAHAAGMGFLVWFEPERVAGGTLIEQEHPEWVMTAEGQTWSHYNLGIPEAREYMTRYLIAAIQAYGIDCLRIDYNIAPLPFWQRLDAQNPDRVGMAEIRYVEGHYRMWDEILAAYPDLFIDNCSSGGMRIDLETCARSIPLWRTDATIAPLWADDFDQAALQNQVMTAGLSRYMPYNTSGQMGASPYHFRSGFNAGISFGEDCRPAGYPLELLKQAIAEGKRIRKYYRGNFYPLGEVTTSAQDWCVMQYHRPAEADGMVLALRRHRSPYPTYLCELQEIDPQAEYQVTLAYGYEPSPPVTMAGMALRRLRIEIEDSPGAVVVEYRKYS